MSNRECKKKTNYKSTDITKNMMCAGYAQGKIDACQVKMKKTTKSYLEHENISYLSIIGYITFCIKIY